MFTIIILGGDFMFSKRLKDLRQEKEITQEDLGKVLNKTKNNISQYETNKREPDNDTLSRIAEYFNVSIDYLLGRSDICNPSNKDQLETTKAYHNLDASGLSDEDIKKVEEYIDLLKQKYNRDGSLNKNR
jgi:transcriptional regulator with XRE-family HTH domain